MRTAIIAFGLLTACLNSVYAGEDWADGFTDPPMTARPHTWWHWVNGNVSREGITKDLEAMKQIGLGGFQAFHIDSAIPRGDVGYMTPEWRELMKHAVQEADRLGLRMCLHNCAGWSSSGGPWITPENSMKELVWTELRVDGPTKRVRIERPQARHDFYRDICLAAFPTPAAERRSGQGFRIEDIKAKAGFARGNNIQPDPRTAPPDAALPLASIRVLEGSPNESGEFACELPAGDWTLLRIGYTTNGRTNAPAPPEGRGLECDKLSTDGADQHWRGIVEKVLADSTPLVGKTLDNVLIDSYETGQQNWTRNMRQEFQARRGYDLLPYLPTVTGRVVENTAVSERFLWDFRRTIADLFCEKYYARFAELCHRRGLKLSVEAYGGWTGNFHDLEVAAVADIPMGEFWAKRRLDWCEWSVKLASSAAHAMGNKYVGAESFTSAPQQANWSMHPGQLKAQGDYFFTKGLNRIIFHTYAHKPWPDNIQPGMTMSEYGMQLNRKNTWFADGRDWIDYLARSQYLLQQGQFVADLCYVWSENAPNQLERRDNLTPRPPNGFDYDAISIKTMMTMRVVDGQLQLPSGMRYRVLVLPNDRTMRPEVLTKVKQLADAGAVIVGPRAEASPSLQGYPTCDQQVRALAEQLWVNGQVHPADIGLEEVLTSEGVQPDFQLDSPALANPLLYLHRRIGDADVYFVSNQRNQPVQAGCVFRVSGAQPELWRPEDGSRQPAGLWHATSDGRTCVTLTLDAAESVFVVFQPTHSPSEHAVAASGPEGEFLTSASLPNVVVRMARYGVVDGADDRWVDVTEQVQRLAIQNQGEVVASNALAGDPAENIVKQLSIEYEVDGAPRSLLLDEGAMGSLYEESANNAPPAAQIVAEGLGLNLVTYTGGDYEIVLPNGESERIAAESPRPSTEVTGPWEVELSGAVPAPDARQTLRLPRLISLAEHEDERVRYFAGHATYQATFTLADDQIGGDSRVLLDLGQVEALAKVTLNGQDLGALWKAPYRIDVTSAISAGDNQLTVRVAVLWPNRLIGDLRLRGSKATGQGPTSRRTPEWVRSGGPLPDGPAKTYVAWRHWLPTDELLPAGLIGPVKLRFATVVPLR
ncbi:MAG: hypothetical protein KDA37_06870 [Planctomycetales bacterium]|nr:hypothetical protein [Planctomycetales bacterium]